MNTLWIIVALLLGAAALMGMVRLLLGPSILDRALSVDALLAFTLAGLGAYAAFHRDPTVLPSLLVLSLLGFVGSVSIAKFVARRSNEDEDEEPAMSPSGEGTAEEEGKTS